VDRRDQQGATPARGSVRERAPTTRLTANDIKALVASLRDITATLAAADPEDKAKVYAEIDITYHQNGRVVVESRPRAVESSVGERTLSPCSGRIPNRAISSHLGTSKYRTEPGDSVTQPSVQAGCDRGPALTLGGWSEPSRRSVFAGRQRKRDLPIVRASKKAHWSSLL
jgi:hypothetical protein